MSRSDILAYVGILLGLPSFVGLFFTPYRTAAALTLLIGIMIYAFSKLEQAPPWTILDFVKTVEIRTTTGTLATVTVSLKVRPNHRGYTQYVFRGIRSDGSCQNFRLANTPVDPADAKQERGEYFIPVKFQFSLPPWRPKQLSELKYDLVDSFKNLKSESTSYTPHYFTKSARIEVVLPTGKPARNAVAIARTGAGDHELEKPELSPDGIKIIWTCTRLRPWQSYIIFWDW